MEKSPHDKWQSNSIVVFAMVLQFFVGLLTILVCQYDNGKQDFFYDGEAGSGCDCFILVVARCCQISYTLFKAGQA